MTDWLYEATNAQARLETAMSNMGDLERKIKKYEDVLNKIATDEEVSDPARVRWQRDHYRSISRVVLGYETIGKQTEE